MIEANEYFMGIDDGGYDGSTFTICVMKRGKNGHTTVEYLKSTRDRKFFIYEKDRLKNWHKIPDKQIAEYVN